MSGEAAADAAHQAFDRGDFATARKLAKQLLRENPDAPTRAAAESILFKTSLDPLIVAVTAFCMLLFLSIAVFGR